MHEALASLVKGCCYNSLSCSETTADRGVPISDQEACDEFLHHLFKGLCATQPNVPGCGKITHGYATRTQVTHKLGSVLSRRKTMCRVLQLVGLSHSPTGSSPCIVSCRADAPTIKLRATYIYHTFIMNAVFHEYSMDVVPGFAACRPYTLSL